MDSVKIKSIDTNYKSPEESKFSDLNSQKGSNISSTNETYSTKMSHNSDTKDSINTNKT